MTSLKEQLRRDILRRRDAIPPDKRAAKDFLIKERLLSLPEFVEAKTVLFYASFRSEVDTIGMVNDSLKAGKRVGLPRVDKQRHLLLLFEIVKMSELSAGYIGIPEPPLRDEMAMEIEDIDIIIVPGVAFDNSCNRIGYGAGYYDILLSKRKKKTPVIALAYEEQFVGAIPAEKHDIKVDVVVSDKRVVRIT
jgi:5-formyltetrahydrofolate cyclo-ligase